MNKPLHGKLDIYCEEGERDGLIGAVINWKGFLRPAAITQDRKHIFRWLGRSCVRDDSPRRKAQNFVLGW